MDALTHNTIVSIAAILIPAIITLVNNHYAHEHELKMHRERIIDERQNTAIQKYLESVGKYIFDFGVSDDILPDVFSSIYIYAPKNLHDQIREMNNIILQISHSDSKEENKDKAQQKYISLCEAFSLINRTKELDEDKRKIKHD